MRRLPTARAKTLDNRFVRWGAKGVWQRLFRALATAGDPPMEVTLDATDAKAFHAPRAGKGDQAQGMIGRTGNPCVDGPRGARVLRGLDAPVRVRSRVRPFGAARAAGPDGFRERLPNIAAACLAVGSRGVVRPSVRPIVIFSCTLLAPWPGRGRSGVGGCRPAPGLAVGPHRPDRGGTKQASWGAPAAGDLVGEGHRDELARLARLQREQPGEALAAPGGPERIAAVAPSTGNWRRRSLPERPIPPRCGQPAVAFRFCARPSQAAASRPPPPPRAAPRYGQDPSPPPRRTRPRGRATRPPPGSLAQQQRAHQEQHRRCLRPTPRTPARTACPDARRFRHRLGVDPIVFAALDERLHVLRRDQPHPVARTLHQPPLVVRCPTRLQHHRGRRKRGEDPSTRDRCSSRCNTTQSAASTPSSVNTYFHMSSPIRFSSIGRLLAWLLGAKPCGTQGRGAAHINRAACREGARCEEGGTGSGRGGSGNSGFDWGVGLGLPSDLAARVELRSPPDRPRTR